MSKIFLIDDFQNKIKTLNRSNKTIGLCHGVFDLLHLGHFRHFQEAKKNADIFLVLVYVKHFLPV